MNLDIVDSSIDSSIKWYKKLNPKWNVAKVLEKIPDVILYDIIYDVMDEIFYDMDIDFQFCDPPSTQKIFPIIDKVEIDFSINEYKDEFFEKLKAYDFINVEHVSNSMYNFYIDHDKIKKHIKKKKNRKLFTCLMWKELKWKMMNTVLK